MTMPVLARPVTRSILAKPPYDSVDGSTLVDPSTCVDLEHYLDPDPEQGKEHIRVVWVQLVFGANFNDPPQLRYPGYRQIMSSAVRRGRF
jgi:cyanobactin biosynthesis protein (PatB/AcyB/McaB family)